MKRITTLTLNPAFDLHCQCASFDVGQENYAGSISRFLGGKGINVSRALTVNGINNTAVAVLGEENASSFLEMAGNEHLSVRPIPVPGCIRENLTIHQANGIETRLSFDSFSCADTVLDEVYRILKPNDRAVVVFSGRLPGGVSTQKTLDFLSRIMRSGAFLAVDSNSFSLEDLITLKPSLIKPNEAELAAFGLPADTDEVCLSSAKRLHESGIDYVLISRGHKDGCFAGKDGLFRIRPAAIRPLSTIGAGDSTIAGFLAGFTNGQSIQDCLKTAFAFGSAACLKEGTLPPDSADIARLFEQTQIIPVTAM